MSHITKDDLETPPQRFRKFLARMRVHLARFAEVYRQPLSAIAIEAYVEPLKHLTPEQLDAACARVLETSEFMPVPATILRCHKELYNVEPIFLGPPLLKYDDPQMTPEEREEALKFSAKMKEVIGVPAAPGAPPPEKKPMTFLRNPEEHQKILEEQLKRIREKK